MDDAVRVAVREGGRDVAREVRGRALREGADLAQPLEELAAGGVLHDEEVVRRVLEVLVGSEHVRVVQEPQGRDLAPQLRKGLVVALAPGGPLAADLDGAELGLAGRAGLAAGEEAPGPVALAPLQAAEVDDGRRARAQHAERRVLGPVGLRELRAVRVPDEARGRVARRELGPHEADDVVALLPQHLQELALVREAARHARRARRGAAAGGAAEAPAGLHGRDRRAHRSVPGGGFGEGSPR